jgi:membrane associated rhomboid family serine protease
MFIPLHDDTPLQVIRFQFVTIAIIALNVVIFLFTGAFSGDAVLASFEQSFGVVPTELLHSPIAAGVLPEPVTLVTYLFLHAGWMHLIGNMLFLWVFADNVEDAFGYAGFAIFYLLTGVIGALTFVYMAPQSPNPLIGASGAVSGVLAAYLVLYPRARVWILLFMRIPVPVPAIVVLGGWFLLQVFSLAAAGPEDDVAWWAHIGGFTAGLVLTLLLRNRLLIKPNSRI